MKFVKEGFDDVSNSELDEANGGASVKCLQKLST